MITVPTVLVFGAGVAVSRYRTTRVVVYQEMLSKIRRQTKDLRHAV